MRLQIAATVLVTTLISPAFANSVTWKGTGEKAKFAKSYIAPLVKSLLTSGLDPQDETDTQIIKQFEYGTTGNTMWLRAQLRFPKKGAADLETLAKGDFSPFFQVKHELEIPKGEEIETVPYKLVPDGIVHTEGIPHKDIGTVARPVFYKGDAFGSFAYMRFGKGKMTSIDVYRDMIRGLAWFERSVDQKGKATYKLHREHAGRRILEHFLKDVGSSKIVLYRGAYEGEAHLIQIARDLLQGRVPHETSLNSLAKMTALDATDEYRQLLERAGKMAGESSGVMRKLGLDLIDEMAKKTRGGLFFTPEEYYATYFSKGQVTTLTITSDQLRELYEAGLLYVGIENAVEFSVFGAEGIRRLIESTEMSSKVVPVNLFGIDMDGGGHLLFDFAE